MTHNHDDERDIGPRLMSLLDAFEAALDDQDPEIEPDADTDVVDEDEARAAQQRVPGALGHTTDDETDAPVGPAYDEDRTLSAFTAIVAANWLALPQDSEPVLLRRQGRALETLDIHIPELTEVGYLPDVEVERDVDDEAKTATVTLLLNRGPQWTPTTRLRMCLADETGDRTAAVTVSSYGVATFHDVPIGVIEQPGLQLRLSS